MNEKATISNGYRWRLGIIGLACLLFAGWFFYDGAVKYPQKRETYLEYERMRQEYPTDFTERWAAHATEQGWNVGVPTEYNENDILMQYVMGAITLPIGLLFTGAFILSSRRWVSADDEGLHANGGRHAPWSAIKSIDKSRWKTKGIAVVHYDDRGTTRKITLDDWKFEREPTTRIVAEVDRRLGNEPGPEAPGEPGAAQEKARELAS